jgi:hypothetical protein
VIGDVVGSKAKDMEEAKGAEGAPRKDPIDNRLAASKPYTACAGLVRKFPEYLRLINEAKTPATPKVWQH